MRSEEPQIVSLKLLEKKDRIEWVGGYCMDNPSYISTIIMDTYKIAWWLSEMERRYPEVAVLERLEGDTPKTTILKLKKRHVRKG